MNDNKNKQNGTAKNLSLEQRTHLLNICNKIKKKEEVEFEEIIELERFIKSIKYGLNFERHEERVDEEMRTHVPTLKSFKEITSDPSLPYNFLLEGDNLHSLKLLEKTHKGRIDVIYIDPPYNTLKDDFAYGDKMIDEEDGFKHSKWLSFMKERLEIARKLLNKTGLIFISIDEHEFAQLKLLCDSVFRESNFIENFIWVKNSTKNLSSTTSTNHEYILCYAKDIYHVQKDEDMFRVQKAGLTEVKRILRKATEKRLTPQETEKQLRDFYKSRPELKGIKQYNKVDYGPKSSAQKCLKAYRLDNISAPKATGKAATYTVLHPIDGLPCKCPTSGWRFTRETMEQNIKEGLVEFYTDHNHVPQIKRYLDTVETEVLKSIIQDFKDGKKELAAIFGESPFENPKPTTLLKTLLGCCKQNAIVLDFFAGSGSTAHAVMALNQEDGGNRQYILCTNNEVSPKGTLKYLHKYGYLKEINENAQNKTIQSKLNVFFKENPDVYNKLIIENHTEYETYGICQSITFPRLKIVTTGIRPDGSKYSDGIKSNLKYFQCEMIPKEKEDLEDDIIDACTTLVELENAIDRNDVHIRIVFNDEELREITDNWDDRIQKIYLSSDIEPDGYQEDLFEEKGVKIVDIPQYYYREV